MSKDANKKLKNRKLLLLTSMGALAFPISVVACSNSESSAENKSIIKNIDDLNSKKAIKFENKNFTQDVANNLSKDNILDYVSLPKYIDKNKLDVVDFKKYNNSVKFKLQCGNYTSSLISLSFNIVAQPDPNKPNPPKPDPNPNPNPDPEKPTPPTPNPDPEPEKPPVSQSELDKEVERVNKIDNLFINNLISKDNINSINSNYLNKYIINLNPNSSFNYEYRILSINEKTIKFKIVISNNGNEKETKEFEITSNVIPFSQDKINNLDEARYEGFKSFSTYSYEDIATNQRQINNSYYNGSNLLSEKYKGTSFDYPGWNHNYETNENFRYIEYNGQRIDLCQELLTERTEDGRKYNDENYINEQIQNGTLKRHPASKNQYEQNIDAIIETVDRHFEIGTDYPGMIPTGLWAPAGELVEIQFDDDTWEKLSKSGWHDIWVDINHNFWDNKAETDDGRISNRYPYIQTGFHVVPENINNRKKTITIGSPFGGNISIGIGSKWYTDSFLKTTSTIKLTIKNAIKTMYYVEGQTSKEDWDRQIEEVKQGKLAPSFDALCAYCSMNIPFTRINEIGYYPLDEIVYPKDTFNKLNDFMFLSNYFSSRDIDGDVRRLDMQFCDDVWGGALAWGGGDALWCAPADGVSTFLLGADKFGWWSFYSNWLSFHEINHNFEENYVLFKWIESKMHAQTNQVNIYDFAKTGDIGRWRNHWNFYGEPITAKPGYIGIGAAPYANSFSVIAHYNIMINGGGGAIDPKKPKGDEYTMYAQMMHTIGPNGYAEYVRWANKNHRNDAPGWTYMGEIESLSNYFGINLWPAIHTLTDAYNWNVDSPLWINGATGPENRWPANYESATAEEKAIIDGLAKKYKAVDFMGNLYACGSYIYDESAPDNFRYTSDTVPPYQVTPGQDYTFDLGTYIISTNPNFKWDQFEFTTPKYGKLRRDPSDPKKLIYTPNINNIGDIDEFDLSIIPANFKDKPANYVPKYKWKIKIKQNLNAAHFRTTKLFADQQMWDESDEMFDRIKTTPTLMEWEYGSLEQFYFDEYGPNKFQKEGLNSQFRFVALSDGSYEFNFKWANAVRIKIDGKEVFRKTTPAGSLGGNPNPQDPDYGHYSYKLNMKKGDSLFFDIDVITNNNYPEWNSDVPGMLRLNVLRNGVKIDYNRNLLLPIVDNLNLEENYIDYLTKEKYQYKIRQVDPELKNNDSIAKYMSRPIIKNDYEHANTNDYWFDTNINDYDTGYDSNFFNQDIKDPGYPSMVNSSQYDFWTNFQKPIKLSSLLFDNDHRGYSGIDDRITNIKVIVTDSQNVEHIAYDGIYGATYHDREEDQTIVPLDKTYEGVTKIKVHVENTNKNKIVFNTFSLMTNPIKRLPTKVNQIISMNSDLVQYNGLWANIKNDEKYNLSQYNNSFFYSQNKNNSFEFNLQNANGFSIVGRSFIDDSLFDVYIDDVKVGSSDAGQQTMTFNYALYYKELDPKKTYRIRIVQKEDKPLYINNICVY